MTRSRLIALLALLVLVWVAGLDARSLIRPDEGRYAEIPREMVATGDWVTPRLDGLKYFEKPALQYWATAIAYETFGEHNWTARLWPALTGLIGLWFVFVAGRRLYGTQVAVAAAAVLASSIWYFSIAHINTLDMGVTCWMTLTLAGFLYAQREDATANERWNGMVAAWAGMGLAMLSKGLIAIVLPGGALVAYTLWQRDWALWRRLHLIVGLAIFLVIAAPWFIVVSLRNPEFAPFFFIHEHFARFSSTEHHRVGAWWYFVPILFAGFVPWTLIFVSRLRHIRQQLATPKAFHPERLLVCWCAVIFFFFSFSGSKLPSYILPMFPGLALLIAPSLAQTSARVYRWNFVAALVAAAACAAALATITRFASPEMPAPLFEAMRPWLVGTVAALTLGAGLALLARKDEPTLQPVFALAFCAMVGWQGIALGYDALSPATSSYHLVRRIEASGEPLRADLPFFSVRTYEQTLPFYLKRTMTLVDYTDELKLGLDMEPELGIAKTGEFVRRWTALAAGYATMKPETFDELSREGLPMREIARDTRRVIVSREGAR